MPELIDKPPRPPARLSAAVKLLLFLAAVAVAGLIVPWCVEDVLGKTGTNWRRGLGVLLVSIVVLSVLLVWIGRTRGPIHAFCLVFGVLTSLCLVVDAGIGLALFDYGLSRDLAVALRIVRVVPSFAAVAAVVGCLLGFVGAMGLSLVQRRAEKAAQARAAAGNKASTPRGRWLPRLAGWALLAGLGFALYFPVAHELRRRHAVLTLRASGAEVLVPRRQFAGGMPQGSAWEALAWLQSGGFEEALAWLQSGGLEGQAEGVLYSLESVSSIQLLDPSTGDVQLACVSQLPEVKSLDLRGAQVTDAGWEQLAGLPTLAFLDVSGSNINDEGLRHLTGATSLRYLNLSQTRISDEGLSHLAGLWLLTQLDVSRTPITDDGLRHLSGMVSLRHVFLGGTRLTGAGLKHLAPIQGLSFLELSHTQLTETGLSRLRGVPQLSVLSFDGAQFNEATFRELSQLAQVSDIHLQGTNVGDAWLPHLARMKNPRLHLRLDRTQVTAEGLRALRESLPQAKVFAGHLEKAGG